nr:Streptomyces cyclase dehydrase domain containing protein [Haemonchus contortus]
MILRIRSRCFTNGVTITKRLFANREKAYSEKRLIGFSREQMFDVVADVKEYRHFIPWCRRSDILEVHGNARIGELEIGFPPLNESYQCRIIVVRPSVVHSVVIGESIFNTLETSFKFAKNDNFSCILHYDLVFEFKSRLHSQMAYLFFDKVVKTMVGAFLRRAEEIHGKPSIPHSKPEILQYRR